MTVAVVVYLVAMVLYGHYRGFLRTSVTAAATVITLACARYGTPVIVSFLRTKTGIPALLEKNILEKIGMTGAEQLTGPAEQRMAIEAANLPEAIKKALVENNNSEIYRMLGVDTFARYVSGYVANCMLGIIVFLLIFLAVFLLLRFLVIALDIIERIPVLAGLNQIAGAVLGGVMALVFLWVAMLMVTACGGTAAGAFLLAEIARSPVASFIYQHNALGLLALMVVKIVL
ncbi:MAG: CvpA family protein [Clostridium sp.]|nr:CvpA family protein [Clostridium sp.]